MDVYNLVKSAVDQIEAADCGFCFELIMGGREDFLNNARRATPDNTFQEPTNCELCCVQVGVFDPKFRDVYETSEYGGIYRMARDWDFQLFFGIPSRIDIQFFDEINKADIAASKWAKLHPLQCCLNSMQLNLCQVYDSCGGCGSTLEVRGWSGQMKLDYLDRNFDGWMITTTVREWIA